MATRTLLCVEPDAKDAELIRAVLAPYGFAVKNFTGAEPALDWGKQNPPSAIVVSVEPRKVGYAICNKIKRSPELKDIPLLLTSAEETQQTFDQHKKLKSRADEYILKPIKKDELLAKVDRLVGLGKAQSAAEEEISLDGDAEEILIADQDIVEEKSEAFPSPFNGGSLAKGADRDAIFQETDAAFESIQSPESTSPLAFSTVPPSGSSSDPTWGGEATHVNPGPPDESPDEFSAPATVASPAGPAILQAISDAAAGVLARPGAGEIFPAAPPDGLHGLSTTDPDLPEAPDVPSPDDVLPALDVSDSFSKASRGSDARLGELQARVHEAETERQRLRTEVDELKARLAAQPISREKDILSLRETINRKEKDVLDLRDALDAKERQILDQKDRNREHERQRRDLEEKMLGVEKNLVAANERVAALSQDKERILDREKGLKTRLDGALMEVQKAHEEIDAQKKRLVATEERSRSEQDRLRGEMEARIAELEEAHRIETTRLGEERVAVESTLRREHSAELARTSEAHAAELGTAKSQGVADLTAANERHEAEIGRTRRDHEKTLASLKDEQVAQLATERQAHQTAVEAKERDHRNEILGMRKRHEGELGGAEERRQKDLAEAEAHKAADLEAAEARRRAELASRDEEQGKVVADMDRRHFEEKSQTAERHRAEIDEIHARAARAEGDLAARGEELAESQRRIAARDADLDAVRGDLRDREVKLAQTRERVAELEAKVVELEEQVLRAYQKLRNDEKTVDKAKRALAVALNLLDGGGNQTQPSAGGAAPAQARSSEEGAT